MTKFWRGWLDMWCGAVALFGAILIGAGAAASEGAARALMDLLAGAPVAFDPALRFAVALMGCVTLGWAITTAGAIHAADRLGAAGTATWRWLTASLVIWFVIDSFFSIHTGFGLNAGSNLVLLIAYLIPVIATGVLGRTRAAA